MNDLPHDVSFGDSFVTFKIPLHTVDGRLLHCDVRCDIAFGYTSYYADCTYIREQETNISVFDKVSWPTVVALEKFALEAYIKNQNENVRTAP